MIIKEKEKIPSSFFTAGVNITADDLIIRKSTLLYIYVHAIVIFNVQRRRQVDSSILSIII